MDRAKKQCLTIVLPAELADMPVRVVRGHDKAEIICSMEEAARISPLRDDGDYVFVWNHNEYRKLSVDAIQWIEADRSYCRIHACGVPEIMVSFPMAVVERALPPSDFVRIHRSIVINLKYVDYLAGNTLKIGSRAFVIGRMYREEVLARFVFIGVRRCPAQR